MRPTWLHFPRSLFGQNLLLMAILIAVAELSFGVLFRQLVQEPRAARMVEVAQLHLQTMHAALQQMNAQQRDAYLKQINAGDSHRVAVSHLGSADHKPMVFAEPPYPTVAVFVQRLNERLGQRYQVGWQEEPERRLWVGTRIDDADYWVGIDAGVFVGTVAPLFAASAVGAGLLALVGAYLIQRRINRPLLALTAATASIGRGDIQPMPSDNLPLEIAQVATSFNKMAATLDAAERERALMLAGVSHDLRTPLAKLRLGVEILAENGEPEIIAGMVRNIAAADDIIGQFVDFARLGNDEALRLCDLDEMAKDVSLTYPPGLVVLELRSRAQLYCRPLAVRRAITNLVENALHHGRHTAENAGVVSLRTSCSERTASISVFDDGPGITVEDMPRLRQPFTRLDQSRSGAVGAGLGLAIVERIAHMHQGELHLLNRSSGGLQATVELPLNP